MPNFDSPISKKTTTTTVSSGPVSGTGGYREFNVPDAGGDYMPPQELSPGEIAEMNRLRQEQATIQNKMSDYAKKRSELLVGIGRLSRDVMLDGITFTLRTLKYREGKEAMLSSLNVKSDAEASFEIRRQTLARSISNIDGKEIDLVLGSLGLEAKLEFIDSLEDIIVDRLYAEFQKLRDEVKNKYGLNTEVAVKEVAADLKK